MEGLESLETLFKLGGGYIALAVEMLAAIMIAWGVIEAVLELVGIRRAAPRAGVSPSDPLHPFVSVRWVFIRFGSWLILALEFELAADVIRSAIAPTWEDIGKLGAIAAIRTFLNYFLERDIDSSTEGLIPRGSAAPRAAGAAEGNA
jgi:uncharacterized membrane protein